MNPLGALCTNPGFCSACLKDWRQFGKTNFLQQSKDDLEIGINNLCDLFIKIILGEGKLEIIPKLLCEMLKFYNEKDFESKLGDVLWLMDSALADATDSTTKERFIKLLISCKSTMSVSILMERLSDDTLEQILLINSRQNFQKRSVRTKTRLFFKQQKFNLLREESEGYAKLIVELSNPMTTMDNFMTHIRSLIGYFDLDPNRVLDIILDACEVRTDMHLLFVELITLYQPDKVDLTHILGHKFHFYQGRGSSTPESLHQLTALLITKKMVDIEVLLTHLQPLDEVIHTGRLKSIREAKTYIPVPQAGLGFSQASFNAIISGGLDYLPGSVAPSNNGGGLLGDPNRALPPSGGHGDSDWNGRNPREGGGRGVEPTEQNDTWSPAGNGSGSAPILNDDLESKEDIVPEDEIGEFLFPNNQKLDVCVALIRSGDWPSAQKILDRFPGHWVGSYPPLNKAICDLIHFLIEPLYASDCPLPSSMMRRRKKPTTPKLFFNSSSKLTSNPFTYLIATDFANLSRHVLPITGYLGPFLSSDIILLVKLCRICSVYISALSNQKGSPNSVYQAIFNMLDESILPSLSMVPANCCLSEEIWKLMRCLPYDQRYRLYGQWKYINCQGEPALIKKRAIVLARTKAIMKRLSKENVKQLGRHLGKLSHSHPGLIFDFILQNIQLFTNLIGPVVESLKYVSSLSYDVLAFCLIEALAADKPKLDDLQRLQCLQALSNFTGSLCKKYQFDTAGILQYVLNQLKAGKSEDLLILREIIHQLSGVDTSEEMTEEQLEAAAGGELLLQEGGYYAQIRNSRKNAMRLKEALIDNQMIMPFVFLMAQQRDAIIYLDDPERHVKVAGRLYDQCQRSLVQFITFLSLQLTREEMQAQCLPIDQMMRDYYVSADTAFCLFRALFGQRVVRVFETTLEKMNDNDKTISGISSTKIAFVSASRHVITEVAQAISPLYPQRIWDELGASFFATFWCLESGDLMVPDAAYQRQANQLRDQLHAIDRNNDWTAAKKKRETDRCQALINRLSREHVARQVHVDRVHAFLLSERDTWFPTMSATKTDTITQFLQYCIYPRACFTANDSLYAAQFIHVLHQLKASRFSTLICLDRIFNDITLPISMCSEDEAHRYGRFLNAVLDLVMKWHSSEETFNQECGQFPGFVTVFRKGCDANTKADQLQYENYRHVVHKWHYRITKAVVACLESGHYAQIRNTLVVLTRILVHYPKVNQFGLAVERRVNKLKEEEKDKRPDLKVLALSYAGQMRPKKAIWVSEEDFHEIEQKPATSVTTQTTVASQGSFVVPKSNTSRTTTNVSTTGKVEESVSNRQSPSRGITDVRGPSLDGPSDQSRKQISNSSQQAGVAYHRSGKPLSSVSSAASQKRNSATVHESQIVNVEFSGPAAASEDIREGKYRRNAFADGSYAISSAKRLRVSVPQTTSTPIAPVSTTTTTVTVSSSPDESKEARRLLRKRQAAAASLASQTATEAEGRASVGLEPGVYEDIDSNLSGGSNSVKKSRKGASRTSTPLEGRVEISTSEPRRRHRRSSTSAHRTHRHRSARHSGSLSADEPTLSTPSPVSMATTANSVAAISRHCRK